MMKYTVPNIDDRYSRFDTDEVKFYSIEYCYNMADTDKNNRYSRFDPSSSVRYQNVTTLSTVSMHFNR